MASRTVAGRVARVHAQRHRIVLAAVALLLMSGCTVPHHDPDAARPRTDDEGAGPVDRLLAFPACSGTCFELTVASAGEVLYAGTNGGKISVLHPGRPAQQKELPPLPAELPPNTQDGDAQLVVCNDILYISSFLFVDGHITSLGPASYGFRVLGSADHGATWPIDTTVWLGNAESRPAGVDRQWLGCGAQGDLFLTINQLSHGIRVAWSADGGRTFAPWQTVVSHDQRGQVSAASPPVVDSSGQLFVPYWAGHGTHSEGRSVRIAISQDNGRTFQHREVVEAGGPGAPQVGWWPALAVTGADELVMAWHGFPEHLFDSEGIWVARSVDSGLTWSEAVKWVDGRSIPAGVWLDAAGEHVALAWFEATADSQEFLLKVQGARTDGGLRFLPAHVVASLPSVNTDFAHLVLTNENRFATVWGDASTAEGAVAVGPLEAVSLCDEGPCPPS